MENLKMIKLYLITSCVIMWTRSNIVSAKAGIKCYCTSLECETSGENMCTSMLGKCFSQLALNSGLKDIHGCTEQLNTHMRTSCLQNGQGDIISTKKDSSFALMCCTGNLCNYLDSKDRPMSLDIVNDDESAANGSNGLDFNLKGSSGRNFLNNGLAMNGQSDSDVYYSSRELWFKAAVIAVPIAGGFILIMLVFLAIRMLRHDNRRHRELKHNQSLAKAQLYVTDHFYNPSNKLLSTSCSNSGGGAVGGIVGGVADDEYDCYKVGHTPPPTFQHQDCVYVTEHQLDMAMGKQQQHPQSKAYHLMIQQQLHNQFSPELNRFSQHQNQFIPEQQDKTGLTADLSHFPKTDSRTGCGFGSIATDSVQRNESNCAKHYHNVILNNAPSNHSASNNVTSLNSSINNNSNQEKSTCNENNLPIVCNSDVVGSQRNNGSLDNNSDDMSNCNHKNNHKHNHCNHGSNHHHHHHHCRNKHHGNQSNSNQSSKTYAYEKLRESNAFENPCESVIVWNNDDCGSADNKNKIVGPNV